ncbi:hypothetical protein [Cellulomonas palmilytica]|uniref:hypothetical protein n=1 Tax=Cellulomonas palmilytica TaxID=2608402 RepID=UPI001F3CC03B|nr:hypothetical protein [Cellulomonas palmilytica]UJP40074.1 hypothetical protein F1D97_00495 [Cellulomonas palmilytica]
MARRGPGGLPLRWCLAAYPPRWRAARAREVADLLADIAEIGGSDPQRVGVREGFGLVRGGLATRVRTGPPLRTRAAYRLLDTRIPVHHRGWAHDERSTVSGALGEWLWSAWPFLAVAALTRTGSFLAYVLALLPVVLLRRAVHLNRWRAKHLVAQPGEAPTPWDLGWDWAPRRRFAARTALRWVAAGVLAGTLAAVGVVLAAPGHLEVVSCGQVCVETTAVPPGGFGPVAAAVVVCGLLVGTLAAVRAVRRVRPRLDAPHDQPHRLVVRDHLRSGLVALLAVALTVFLLSFEVSYAPVLSYAVVGGGLVVLPPLVALLVVLRGPADEVALVDVVALLRGRVPALDTPRAAPVRGTTAGPVLREADR